MEDQTQKAIDNALIVMRNVIKNPQLAKLLLPGAVAGLERAAKKVAVFEANDRVYFEGQSCYVISVDLFGICRIGFCFGSDEERMWVKASELTHRD